MSFSTILAIVLSLCGLGASPVSNQAMLTVASQNKNFIAVDGPNLKARMDAAIRMGRSNSSGPFWTAYTFDVRPGISVDAERNEFNGNITTFSDTNIAIGTSNGVTVETRNLGIFLLHESNSEAITRVEVYNLDRKREYSGYPVYWLGRGDNQESLNFLRGQIQADQASRISEHLVVAIGLHDDPGVAGILKDFVRSSTQQRVRSTAVFWLGQVGGEQQFLSDLARNEQENTEVRKQAAFSIGVGKDKKSIMALEKLYQEVSNRTVKKEIVFAASINETRDESVNFLIKVADNDADRELKKRPSSRLGQKAGQRSLEALGNTVNDSDAETEVQKQAVFAISQRRKDESVPALIKIARTHPKAAIRKQAMFWLGQTDDDRALAFFKEILTK